MSLDLDWSGFDCFCLASGPSLTAEDVALVHAWRHSAEDRRVIAVNSTSFTLCPWADVVYGKDSAWWKRHLADVEAACTGVRASARPLPPSFNVTRLPPAVKQWSNSGFDAISLAAHFKAKRVYLLGYDFCLHSGRIHHFGDHPKELGNAGSMRNWLPQQLNMRTYAAAAGVDVVNCTRKTALTAWPIVPLEEALP